MKQIAVDDATYRRLLAIIAEDRRPMPEVLSAAVKQFGRYPDTVRAGAYPPWLEEADDVTDEDVRNILENL